MEMTVVPSTPRTVPQEPIKLDDPFLVAFSPQFDALNPKDWSAGRKWTVTDVMSASGFNRIMVSTIMAPALTTIAGELNMSPTESAMSLSIFLIASAFGPILIGPLSEIFGREVILHTTSIWFLVWNAVCGFAHTKEVLIAARFMAGFGASSIYALAGGVLGDIWRPEQRGNSLGIYLLIPILGAAVGPIIGGFMAGRTTWRWMFWSTSIFQVVMILVSFTAFKETYAPVILKRRAAKLRKTTGDERYCTIHEHLEEKKPVWSILWKALSRPLRLLAFHPLIQAASIISAFYYGLLYILLSSFSQLWTERYNISVEISGLHYLAIAGGELAGSQIGGYVLDKAYARIQARHPDTALEPESRILLALPGAILAPLFLVFYGWTAEYRVHWIVVDMAIFLVCFATQFISIAQQAYMMDVYHEHTSSALAAGQFPRSLCSFLFPLFTPTMYNVLGYGWGNSSVALAGLVLGLPASLLLWKFGKRMRMKSASTY
ncbi:MFS general substrate transporter [Byssothecium circinans]|uniref:MFS general substrate transporter n=1 Tax=Byssothecium circinans TaxID=147558 RepID=A0A6A5UAT0_9PLEO|nr:MFS general substrate transporter [Byssothecium circinans]